MTDINRRRSDAPLLARVQRAANHNLARFHIPGHRGVRGVPGRLIRALGVRPFMLDLTSLPELDCPWEATGVLWRAQALAARAFGAAETMFLVNGSTAGNHAMLLAYGQPGDEILVGRNAHVSVIAGLILSGLKPIYVPVAVEPNLGFPLNLDAAALSAVLAANPQCRLILVTSPNYYGVAADLRNIADIATRCGCTFLADEAHGAHFHFHPMLPVSALDAGATCAVQSTHKTLGALTQTAMLHCARRQDAPRLRWALRMLQTTGPSYLFLSALDAVREEMVSRGRRLLQTALLRSEIARHLIQREEGLRVLGAADMPQGFQHDPTRLVISAADRGWSGVAVARWLRSRGVEVEMADRRWVICIISVGTTRLDVQRLHTALRSLPRRKARSPRITDASPRQGPIVMLPRDAWFSSHRRVPLHESAGEICGRLLLSFPPSVPLLVPGEEILPEHIAYIEALIRTPGVAVRGTARDERGRCFVEVVDPA